MDLYFEGNILQHPVAKGCQVYAYNILREMIAVAPEHTFHLHFAMEGWHPRIDDLLSWSNVRSHRWRGPFGRHVALPIEIARTRSRAFLMLNGNTGRLRVPVPCASAAVCHDLRFVLCRDIYGDDVCEEFTRSAKRWIAARDCIVTGAETVKRELMEAFDIPARRIVVAPESTDHHPGDAPESRLTVVDEGLSYFLMVNPGEVRKNWQDALDGFARYMLENPDDARTKLILVGGLNDQATAIGERLRKDAALAARTMILEHVSDEELRYLYRNARLTVYPSKYEGFGIPVLESLGHGTPVIASDIPIFHEVAGDAAIFVRVGAPEEIARAMQRLQTDATLRNDLAVKGKERARRFSWRRSAEVLLEALVRLGRDGRGRRGERS